MLEQSSFREGEGRRSIACAVAVAYFAWFCFGFITGAHWGVLACYTNGALVHMFVFWVLAGIFVAFRYPLPSWSKHCTDNSTMSRDCLFEEQDSRYAFFYVTHIMILVFVFVLYFAQGCMLYSWVKATLRSEQIDSEDPEDPKPHQDEQQKLRFCCSSYHHKFTYLLALVVTILIVGIWCAIPWTIG